MPSEYQMWRGRLFFYSKVGACLTAIEPNLHRATRVDWHTKPTYVDAIPQ
jgi:hypothetical protein